MGQVEGYQEIKLLDESKMIIVLIFKSIPVQSIS